MNSDSFDAMSRTPRLLRGDITRLWNAAAKYDETLALRPRFIAAIARKRVVPMAFSRAKLFDHMARCEPVLFSNVPIRPVRRNGGPKNASILEEIRGGFPRREKARVRTENSIAYVPVKHVVDKWANAKSVFGVTDFHYIGTHFDASIDTHALNDFNILPRGTDGFQSQDSLVISSTGAYTDSHSDDHSGSNHSFVGTKLWLLWDTQEGLRRGLEDVERCDVYGRAAFDLKTFLSLRSSSWILIGPGQTMFIPAHLTHKVITLQRYLGLGSFHAGYPGFIDLLVRWNELPPLWAARAAKGSPRSVESITRRAIRKMQALAKAGTAERNRWGVPYLKANLRRLGLDREMPKNAMLKENPNLRAFVKAAREL